MLTDDEICNIAKLTETAESGTEGYILPVSFARAIIAAHTAKLSGVDMEPVAWMRQHKGVPDKLTTFTDDPEAAARWGELGSPLEPMFSATQLAAVLVQVAADKKLWLWKNFVNGRPEYWAFDNAFPIHMDHGDPQTLGEPCGYALFKPSRNAKPDIGEAEVFRRIAEAIKNEDQGTPFQKFMYCEGSELLSQSMKKAMAATWRAACKVCFEDEEMRRARAQQEQKQ
jgi:hypothetical protein